MLDSEPDNTTETAGPAAGAPTGAAPSAPVTRPRRRAASRPAGPPRPVVQDSAEDTPPTETATPPTVATDDAQDASGAEAAPAKKATRKTAAKAPAKKAATAKKAAPAKKATAKKSAEKPATNEKPATKRTAAKRTARKASEPADGAGVTAADGTAGDAIALQAAVDDTAPTIPDVASEALSAPVDQAQSVEAQSVEAQPASAQSADARSADAPNAERQPAGAQTAGAQTADAQTADAQTADAQTADAQAADAQAGDAQTGDAQTADAEARAADDAIQAAIESALRARAAAEQAPVATPEPVLTDGTESAEGAEAEATGPDAGSAEATGPDAGSAEGDDETATQTADEPTAPEATDESESEDEGDDQVDENEDQADDSEGEGGGRRRRRRRGGRRRRRGRDRDSDDSSDDQAAESESDTAGGADQQHSAGPKADEDGSNESGDQAGNDQDGNDRADNGQPHHAQADAGKDEEKSDDSESDNEDGDGDSDESSDGHRRRRRRRRRRGEETAGAAADPSEVGVRVRERRKAADEVTGIEGSTRMEAKRQRRREGREAGRRRAPIISEAEFLARRELVDRKMVIRQRDDLAQIAVLEDGILVEHYVDRESANSLIGNVYLGRVQNVLPSMEAAFIDIGRGRNAVLYAGEVNWDAYSVEGPDRKVEKVLKSGQTVLVQVTKDPVGAKGARLTNHVSIPGRYVVYAPGGHLSGISRKLPDTERKRLKDILDSAVGDTASVIVRTAAEGASEDELTRDVNRLKAQWDDIERKVKTGNGPQVLYSEPDLTLRIVRDLFTEDFSELIIQGNGEMNDAYEAIQAYVGHVAPHLAGRLRRWDADANGDLFGSYRLDEQIAKGLERKVFLPSGGSLIIDRTEAMTVIDVNTGKFTGSGGNLEATITSNNLEAAEEIVRQLRLRDIGGIIVIDFIDMVLPNNRDLLLRRLVECLGRDRTRHQVAEVTSLGLVQMTRKRIGSGLLEAFSTECPHCHGRGVELHDVPVTDAKMADGGTRDDNGGGKRRRNRGGGGGRKGNDKGNDTGNDTGNDRPEENGKAEGDGRTENTSGDGGHGRSDDTGGSRSDDTSADAGQTEAAPVD